LFSGTFIKAYKISGIREETLPGPELAFHMNKLQVVEDLDRKQKSSGKVSISYPSIHEKN